MTRSCANMSGKRLRSRSFVVLPCTVMKHSHSNYISLLLSCYPIPAAAWPVFIHSNTTTVHSPLVLFFLSRNGSMMCGPVPSQARGTTSKPAPSLWPSMLIRLVRQNIFGEQFRSLERFLRIVNHANVKISGRIRFLNEKKKVLCLSINHAGLQLSSLSPMA